MIRHFSAWSHRAALFWASLLSLYLELSLIRWVGSEIRIFAYCKNLVLLAAFLGLGLGCFLKGRRSNVFLSLLLLTLLVVLVEAPIPVLQNGGPQGITGTLSVFADFQVWDPASVSHNWLQNVGRLAFGLGWTAAIFFILAAICFPYGQAIGRMMDEVKPALAAYSMNVVGAMAGIALFSVLSWLETAPLQWFAVVFLLSCPLMPSVRHLLAAVLLLALIAGVLYWAYPPGGVVWSQYQKLEIRPDVGRGAVFVNNVGYQAIEPPTRFDRPKPQVNRFSLPFLTNGPKPRKVLILGSGIGNDVIMAVAAGAQEVVAVEIDAAIYRIGQWFHPARPYAFPQVRVVIDDARHYLRNSQERFDRIVFSHLDAHTLLSGYTNVRLDNYIYTIESFREARRLLADGGLLYLSFWAEKAWIVERLHEGLRQALGHEPLALIEAPVPGQSQQLERIVFFAGAQPVGSEVLPDWILDEKRMLPRRVPEHTTPAVTDDWPYLYVAKRQVPALIGLLSALIFVLTWAVLRRPLDGGRAIDWHFFLLGAAFMLVEVHALSKLALLFGTTWWVNTWVIGAILLMVLLSNATVAWLAPRSQHIWYVLLAVSLVAAFAVPLSAVERLPRLVSGAAGLLLMTLPVFFAGLIFATSFARAVHPAIVFGSNMLGAILGGLLESVSFASGLRSLILISLVLYGLSLAALLARSGRAASAQG